MMGKGEEIKQNEVNKERQGDKFRKLDHPVLFIWQGILLLIPILGVSYIISLHEFFGIVIFSEQYAGLFLGLILAAVYIGIPRKRNKHVHKVPWYDWILAIVGLLIGLNIAFFYPQLIVEFSNITLDRFLISIVAVIIILEALRRIMGWVLVSIVLVFLIYAFVGPYLPGIFRGQPTSADVFFNYLYLDTNSILNMARLAATIVLAFVLFGQILLSFNGGNIFNNVAIRLFGRYRGGPAKASIVGSSMVGSTTGDPVSNVTLTGNVSIPLMTKTGYRRDQAGGIEAVASTAGSITPPIMGTVAFLIAENLGVPYIEVALAALIPALLYYASLFVQVDLRAAQQGVTGVPRKDLPDLSLVLKTGWILLPIFFFLIYLLFFEGYPPASAGAYTAGFAFLFLLVQKEVRQNIFSRLVQALTNTGKILLEIGVILSAAGMIAGIVGVTGLGFNIVSALTQIGEYGLPILLVASALVCIILGMGMPALVAYTLVATMIAPALVQLGVEPIAAHLFVFYFAIVSHFTMPVAVTCFAAAPIAQESPYKISFMAMKLAIMVYVIPFLFVYNPIMLLDFETSYDMSAILTIVTIIFAGMVISVSAVGYFSQKLHVLSRLLLIGFSVLMLLPVHQTDYGPILNFLGFLGITVILFLNWFQRKRSYV